jgi:hypothetical protein
LRRKLFATITLLLLVIPITSAQAVNGKQSLRDSKRSAAIREFRSSARGAQAMSSVRGTARVAGDFNKDGTKDLVVGIPGEDGQGAVQVFYGGSTGLKTSNDQIIKLDDWCGGVGAGQAGADFGAAVAVGDFNGDGATDLAVGAPDYDRGGPTNNGVVFLFFGHQGGLLTPASDCQFLQETVSIPASDGEENDDHFGASLAAGNFGGSSHADLAIGIPGEDVGAVSNAGAVGVVYGSPTGLAIPFPAPGNPGPANTTTQPQFWNQDSGSLEGVSEAGDSFGQSLDAGNLGRSSQADLVIGVPDESIGEINDAGAINVLYGSSSGLTVLNDQLWTQDTEGMRDLAEEGDEFGFSLAIGDFGKSTKNDLAVGVILEDGTKAFIVGAVQVLYGSSGGLTATGNKLWSQDSSGVPDAGEVLDLWGYSLAAGNVGKSGKADLIVGAILETPGSTNFGSVCPGPRGCAGQITVLYGSSGGLTSNGAKVFNQDSTGVPDSAEPGDEFGFAVAAGNFGKSSFADVAVGTPFEDIGATSDAGAINELFGTSTGLTGTGARFFSQDSTGVEDTAEANDDFGSSLG